MNETITLLEKSYIGESLCDVSRDVYEALYEDYPAIPKDEYGFQEGRFEIIIKWINENN